MSKAKISCNYEGIGQLLNCQQMNDACMSIVNDIAARCGDGYVASSHKMPQRTIFSVETATKEAALDCEANNTLLKNLG